MIAYYTKTDYPLKIHHYSLKEDSNSVRTDTYSRNQYTEEIYVDIKESSKYILFVHNFNLEFLHVRDIIDLSDLKLEGWIDVNFIFDDVEYEWELHTDTEPNYVNLEKREICFLVEIN
jgi:hypothetical protein